MDSNIGFVSKVLLLSTVLSVAIKYGGPFLAIAPGTINVAIAVILPALIMVIILGGRLLLTGKTPKVSFGEKE